MQRLKCKFSQKIYFFFIYTFCAAFMRIRKTAKKLFEFDGICVITVNLAKISLKLIFLYVHVSSFSQVQAIQAE